MLAIASLLTIAVAVSGTVLPVRPERRLADVEFLKREKQVLDLYVGLGHEEHFTNEHSDWDLSAHYASFTDEKYPRDFWAAYQRGFIPRNAIFSLACGHTRRDAIRLFDLFYFAKDFDTFYMAASWARSHVNHAMFAYAYTLALYHRDDCQSYVIPPIYEIFPNLFVPTETLHRVYDTRMSGVKEGRFNYNNTGYEYNYHSSMFGGVISRDNRGYGDYRISYFREDVGLNAFYAQWFIRNPSWMCPEKYNRSPLLRRGENFYYNLKQIYGRYTLERLANGLPFETVLSWRNPIRVGYNPHLAYMNGQSMYARPDNVVPIDYNLPGVLRAEQLERRIWDAVDSGMLWELHNKSLITLDEHNGVEILGRIIYGTTDRPSGKYYQSFYYAGMDALAYLFTTASDRSYVGNALSTPATALRDPLYYNYIGRILMLFQHYKRSLHPYTRDQLVFNGVTVQNVEVDKLLTYFDLFDYEVTNGVPMVQKEDYTNHRYYARQFRLNHKPYRFNITVNSESTGDAVVRVFIGPKYDSDEHLLTYDQARLAYFEIDRFPVKLSAGVNVWERSSTESPIFVPDQEGFRALYTSVNNAINQKEQFYTSEAGRCGYPERLQLPMGWRGGRTYVLAVVVTPYDQSHAGGEKTADIACGGSRLYDNRPMGFPFDRPIHAKAFNVPNFYFKDVLIYHKEAADINRPSA